MDAQMATGQGFPNSFTEDTGWSQLVFTNLSQSGSSSQLRLEHEGWRLCNWLQLCSRWDLYTRIEMALVHQFEANEKSSFLPIRKQKMDKLHQHDSYGSKLRTKNPIQTFSPSPCGFSSSKPWPRAKLFASSQLLIRWLVESWHHGC